MKIWTLWLSFCQRKEKVNTKSPIQSGSNTSILTFTFISNKLYTLSTTCNLIQSSLISSLNNSETTIVEGCIIYITTSWESMKDFDGYSITSTNTNIFEASLIKLQTKWKISSLKLSKQKCTEFSIETNKKCTILQTTKLDKEGLKKNSTKIEMMHLKKDPKTCFINSWKQTLQTILPSTDLKKIKISLWLLFFLTMIKAKILQKAS